ncbi:MAG: DUF6184 family natural product biosynthesis lipoprotein [Polyangiales bacterium]
MPHLLNTVSRIATLIAGLTFAGCGAHGGLQEHPLSPEARADSVEEAVEAVVHERCDLEERCSHVGPEQTYDSRDACESKLQGTTASELNTNDCPLGVDPKKLDACLAAIRSQACGSVVDSLSRWNACRKGQVCYQP